MKNRNVTFTTILIALGCFALLQRAQGVLPAPDGCYPGFTTAEGCNALKSLTTGIANTAVGWFSQHAVMDGSYNTAVGAGALDLNNANENTAVDTGGNTAVGYQALVNNTANSNTAVGNDSLVFNTTGGMFAGTSYNEVGPNTAVGALALGQNTTAGANTAVGYQALGNMTIGVGT